MMVQSSETPRGQSLPDTAKWQPRQASGSLEAAFAAECNGVEERLLQGLRHEKRFATDGFESGVPFEGLVRQELARLVPKRYSVSSGHVIDRNANSAGQCDVVLFNDAWVSAVKSAATEQSGYRLLPIEGVYAVGEVKQTLTTSSLDQAMEKLVKCHRLHRPRTYAHRVVENREGANCPHGLTNPLFSFILGGSLGPGESLQALIKRFFDINRTLKRLEVVRVLCVLGEGVVTWGFEDPFRGGERRPALFVRDDLFHPIFPVFSPAAFRGPLLFLVQTLQQSLFHTILAPEDLAFAYGLDDSGIKAPADPGIVLLVDSEWAELLGNPCEHDE